MRQQIDAIVNVMNKLSEKAPDAWKELQPDVETMKTAVNQMVFTNDVFTCFVHDLSQLKLPDVNVLLSKYGLQLIRTPEFEGMYRKVMEYIAKRNEEATKQQEAKEDAKDADSSETKGEQPSGADKPAEPTKEMPEVQGKDIPPGGEPEGDAGEVPQVPDSNVRDDKEDAAKPDGTGSGSDSEPAKK